MSSTMFLASMWMLEDEPLISLSREQIISICYALGVIIAVPTFAFFVKLFLVRSRTLRMQEEGFVSIEGSTSQEIEVAHCV